jgi:hypothetical protein
MVLIAGCFYVKPIREPMNRPPGILTPLDAFQQICIDEVRETFAIRAFDPEGDPLTFTFPAVEDDEDMDYDFIPTPEGDGVILAQWIVYTPELLPEGEVTALVRDSEPQSVSLVTWDLTCP